MLIKNGLIYQPNQKFITADLLTDGNFIKDIRIGAAGSSAPGPQQTIDAEGCYVLPGLIDLHLHGCAGADFCINTAKSLHTIAAQQLQWGITGFCPASMTLSEAQLTKIFSQAAAFTAPPTEATLLGVNMEGPFVSPQKLGSQNPLFVHKPDVQLFHRLQTAAQGLIKLVDLAPELEGALDFIAELHREVRISLAHTNATYAQAYAAFSKGARQITHLFNAMTPFNHREPGVLGAAVDTDNILAEIICDGIHLHPATVKLAFRLFGAEKLLLISDSMEACGLKDGNYQLGGQPVTVKGNLATVTGTEIIAGSVTNLMDCLRWTVQTAGIPLEQAISCATANPAKALGRYSCYGSLESGKYADIIILDKQLQLKHIIKHGLQIK